MRDWNRSSVDWEASRRAGAFVMLTPRAPLTTDRRTGGVHRNRKRVLPRKAKHRKGVDASW